MIQIKSRASNDSPQRIHGRDEFKARVTNDIPLNNIEVYVIKLNIWLPTTFPQRYTDVKKSIEWENPIISHRHCTVVLKLKSGIHTILPQRIHGRDKT